MDGCVLYKAGDVPVFPKETIIDPHNRIGMEYPKILAAHTAGTYKDYGTCLTLDFSKRLRTAIDKSYVLSNYEKQILKTFAGL